MSVRTITEIKRLEDEYRFFHWHLEFPEVFGDPGPTAWAPMGGRVVSHGRAVAHHCRSGRDSASHRSADHEPAAQPRFLSWCQPLHAQQSRYRASYEAARACRTIAWAGHSGGIWRPTSVSTLPSTVIWPRDIHPGVAAPCLAAPISSRTRTT